MNLSNYNTTTLSDTTTGAGNAWSNGGSWFSWPTIYK